MSTHQVLITDVSSLLLLQNAAWVYKSLLWKNILMCPHKIDCNKDISEENAPCLTGDEKPNRSPKISLKLAAKWILWSSHDFCHEETD